MQLLHFYHGQQMHRLSRHPQFHLFEFAIWLHTVAHSLIGIFVPILLLRSGYSITHVIIFYLAYNAIDIPFNFVADRAIRKIGARKTLIIGTLASIAFFLVIGVLPPQSWPFIFTLALLAAVYDTFFWISHIYIFIEANRGGLDVGKSVGSLIAIRHIAHIAGPIVGAYILLTLGKASLVVASIVFFTLSMIPLYRMRHLRDIPHGSRIKLKEFLSTPSTKRNYFSLALWGIHGEVDGILWPLFIFTLFGTVESVAAVPVIVSISTALFSYLAGRLTKKFGTRMMIVGCLVIAAAWILRLSFDSSALYYATIFLVGIFSLLVSVPIDVGVVSKGLQGDSLSAATYRNTISMSLRAPLYLVLILLVEIFKFSFSSAALSLLLIIFVISSLNLPQKPKV